MGLLLRVGEGGQLLARVGVHPGALHGPGKDSAGNGTVTSGSPSSAVVGCSLVPSLLFFTAFISQVVTFFHTVLLSKKLKFRTALVICPLNTVLNWAHEFEKWQRNVGSDRVNVRAALYVPLGRF